MITKNDITAVILAGGKASRINNQDKGLLWFNQKPIIQKVIDVVKKEVKTLYISANRNISEYKKLSHNKIIKDDLNDFQGPLAGIHKALSLADNKYLLVLPCDAPFITKKLITRLITGIKDKNISVACSDNRVQAVFALIRVSLKDNLTKFLANGDRKIELWYKSENTAFINVDDNKSWFLNLNTKEDFAKHTNKIFCNKLPLLGFCAYSGMGKTTLITEIIKKITLKGIRVGAIKHAHHDFDIDYPKKDSYKFRENGALQVIVASKKRFALIVENQKKDLEPDLKFLIKNLHYSKLDLILVEGFKHEKINKIELSRKELNKPTLFENDKNIIALISDNKNIKTNRILLDLANIESIVDFIIAYANNYKKH